MKKILFFSLLSVCFFACKKVPGDGGLATITGKVYAKDFDINGFLTGEGYIADEKVFISYGDNTTVDNDVNTSYNGEYKFEFLQKGKYTVFVYTNCDTCSLGTRAIMKVVEINSRKEVVVLEDFNIEK
jgi:hypothetical protein